MKDNYTPDDVVPSDMTDLLVQADLLLKSLIHHLDLFLEKQGESIISGDRTRGWDIQKLRLELNQAYRGNVLRKKGELT